ncbi:XRE family transcriptional regulator [Clostridiaceae bacterium OF09-1]|nr:XRE family transcriptional regulator [Clostridiaceae bacterium OF09-1]
MLLELNDKNIALIIKLARESTGLSQVEFGEHAGYSASTICKFETSKRIPKSTDLFHVLNAAGCQLNISVKIPVYSKYRKEIIGYEMVCLGDFSISKLEI